MTDYPHITVACVIPKANRFLFVRENPNGPIVYNQPAGHLEQNESLISAAERETLEETGWQVKVTHFLGIYQYNSPDNGVCYVRHSFVASPRFFREDFIVDNDIIDTCWLSVGEALALSSEMRSPIVLKTLEDYIDGDHYPLKIISRS